MKGDTELAFKAGCDGYLTKPIDTRTFAKTITRFIESASPGSPNKEIIGKES
jgi:CheY-like chemotaxis protein